MIGDAVGNRAFEGNLSGFKGNFSGFKGKERRGSGGDGDLKKSAEENGLKCNSDRGGTSIVGLGYVEEEVSCKGGWGSKFF